MTTSSSHIPDWLDIRPPRADDSIPVALPTPPIDQDAPRWSRSLVAVTQDHIVGVGWISLAPVTDTYSVEVQVAPDYRRRGIGTALFNAVDARADQSIPVRTRVMSSQPWRREFAESLGYSVLVRCPAPWIDPTSQPGKDWADQHMLPSGYRTQSMAEIQLERVIDAWTTYFEWVHRPFGVVRAEHIRQQWDHYAEGVNPHLSMLTTDETGTVVAFSLVTPDGWQGRTFIVSETVDPQQPDGDILLIATVAASVGALAARGIHLVELEGYSTDPHSPALVRSLPPGGGDPMEIVQLARAQQRVVAASSS